MKKIILLSVIVIGLNSCKKESVEPTQQIDNVYFRIETVSKTGEVSYSDIQRVSVK